MIQSIRIGKKGKRSKQYKGSNKETMQKAAKIYILID